MSKGATVRPLIYLILLLTSISVARADYMADPYIGYGFGNYNSKHDATTHQFDSFVFGSRFAYQYLGAFAGLDLNFSFPTMEQRTPILSTPPRTKYFHWSLAPTIGYRFPLLIRAWVSYILHTQFNARSGSRDDSLSGDGYAVGVGYQLSFIPNIDVFANLEYRRVTIDKVEDDRLAKVYKVENTNNEFLITLSIPFEFSMIFGK